MQVFKLKYYTRRWNSSVTLNVKKTATGWHISHLAINGEGDRDGAPFLEANLHQDNVKFPERVGSFLGFVWEQLHEERIDGARAQQMIDQVGEWISACEQSQPNWKEWNA